MKNRRINSYFAMISSNLAFMLLALIASIPFQTVYAVESGFILENPEWEFSVYLETSMSSCSGTLVDEKYIITAAHCVYSYKGDISVFGGYKAGNYMGDATISFLDPRYNDGVYSYDIAVLELRTPYRFSSPLRSFKIMGSEEYAAMMSGQYPHERVLSVGFGLDEMGRSGVRKAAISNSIAVFIGAGENLLSTRDTWRGANLPGDSGGGVFMVYDDQLVLGATVSGSNQLNQTILGNVDETLAERLSPIAPSLCVAPTSLQKAINFDSSKCDDISRFREALSKPFDSMSLREILWAIKLLSRSPQQSFIVLPEQSQTLHDFRELYVIAILKGSRSEKVAKAAISYLNQGTGSYTERQRRQEYAEGVYESIVGDGSVNERSLKTISPRTVAELLTSLALDWREKSRDNLRNNRHNPCNYNNCLLRNEFFSLVPKYARGDWNSIFPVAEEEELQVSVKTAAEFACLIIPALTNGDFSKADAYLSRLGISRSAISKRSDTESVTVMVDAGETRWRATYFLNDGWYWLQFMTANSDKDYYAELARKFSRQGYVIEDMGNTFEAEYPSRPKERIIVSDVAQSLEIDHMTPDQASLFHLFGCT